MNYSVKSMRYTARNFKGESQKIEMRDYGDLVPAFDKNNEQFQAYTTRFSFEGGAVAYSVVDKDLVDSSENPSEYRWHRDLAVLIDKGFDTSALAEDLESKT